MLPLLLTAVLAAAPAPAAPASAAPAPAVVQPEATVRDPNPAPVATAPPVQDLAGPGSPAEADATQNSAAAESNTGLLVFQIIAMPLLVIGLFVGFMFTVGFILDRTVGRFGLSPASNGIYPPADRPASDRPAN